MDWFAFWVLDSENPNLVYGSGWLWRFGQLGSTPSQPVSLFCKSRSCWI